VTVEIGYSAPSSAFAPGPFAPDPFAGLGVCQGIIRGHGGDLQFRAVAGTCQFEIHLPLTGGAEENATPAAAGLARSILTLMLVDPDPAGQRQVLGLLSVRGHRVVPVPLEEAADLAQRLRFDAVLWAIRPSGTRWNEFQDRIRAHVPTFALMSDGYDPDLARRLEDAGGFLLSRPIQESELDEVLGKIEVRSRNGSAAY
jgi:CheY-like chemotaxis protein